MSAFKSVLKFICNNSALQTHSEVFFWDKVKNLGFSEVDVSEGNLSGFPSEQCGAVSPALTATVK